MRKLLTASIAALALLVSCEEWQPVLTLDYPEPAVPERGVMNPNTTIAELKQMYLDNGSKPLEIVKDVLIGGKVISSDRSGNIYRELYIQDETGAISVKVGKSSLYSDYHRGQWVYVNCKGLTIGSYSGMPQLGIEDETGEYETAYIDSDYLIKTHIFKGVQGERIAPISMTEAELATALSEGGFKSDAWGRLVTLTGLTYGAKTSYSTDSYKRIFALLYIDQSKDKKASSNRIFLSDKTYGVTTWAMSKNKFLEYLDGGNFDDATTGDDRKMTDIQDEATGKTVKQVLRDNAVAVTMSHYFTYGASDVQIRTSGYSRFADTEIDPSILGDLAASQADGASIKVTGILTLYNGAAQFTLIDIDGVEIIQ